MKKNFYEGNQIHNFMSSSGSGTVINYGSGSGSDFLSSYGSGYGSGSTSQKVTVPTVPVPVPVPQHWFSLYHFTLWISLCTWICCGIILLTMYVDFNFFKLIKSLAMLKSTNSLTPCRSKEYAEILAFHIFVECTNISCHSCDYLAIFCRALLPLAASSA